VELQVVTNRDGNEATGMIVVFCSQVVKAVTPSALLDGEHGRVGGDRSKLWGGGMVVVVVVGVVR
jgi:hypothetical protein